MKNPQNKYHKKHKLFLAILFVSIMTGGCRSPEVLPKQKNPTFAHTFYVGMSVEGRLIQGYLWGDSGPVRLLIGCIHGNEPAGIPLTERLIDNLDSLKSWPYKYRILIIPVLNPDGVAHGYRTNARGIDLNRNFPSQNFHKSKRGGQRPLSQPESLALKKVIDRYIPSQIVVFHQPFGLIDYDGPGKKFAHLLSKKSGLPVKKLGGRPGSLGSYAGQDLAIPILTIELPKNAHLESSEQLWSRYGEMVSAGIHSRAGGTEH